MNHLRPHRPIARPVLLAALAALVLAVLLLLARTDLGADPSAPDGPRPAGFQLPRT